MFESRYGKYITIILVVLIILIIAILGYLGYRVIKTLEPGKEGEVGTEKFQNQVIQNNVNQNNVNQNNEESNNVIDVIPEILPENEEYATAGGDGKVKTKTYKGFNMVGTIEIPKTSLKCPVLERATSSAIEVAVGIYAGPGLNKVGNTVIAGHNYRNGTFFSDNKKLLTGDKIYITDLTGKKVIYTIYKVYITSPDDLDYVTRDTKGKREISLTTCTDDTKSRIIIWASAD